MDGPRIFFVNGSDGLENRGDGIFATTRRPPEAAPKRVFYKRGIKEAECEICQDGNSRNIS